MISIAEYDAVETLAIAAYAGLYQDNKWGIVPETQPHLVRVTDLQSLQFLLNRFQCDRFRTYLYELGGLSKLDLEWFNRAKGVLIGMQRRYYPEIAPVVPVETMLSALTIYRKLKAARPNFKTVLEIGPGAGLGSLFFSQDMDVLNYTQIEAQQATYLSQSMVNEGCEIDVLEMASTQSPIGISGQVTRQLWHVPWWRVDDLYATPTVYDAITANACINEISDAMVDRYFNLFNEKSHDGTLLLLQDLGEWMNRDDGVLLNKLNTAGWFLNKETSNWDVERAVGNASHGEAVTTWWLTKHPGEHVDRLTPRLSDGSVIVNEDYRCFSYMLDSELWTRDRLAQVQ